MLCPLVAAWALPLVAVSFGDPLDAFSYTSAEVARQHWEPQFGSSPMGVGARDDGTPCLVLNADFAEAQGRVCWDWSAPLDLSQAGRVAFEIQADDPGLVSTIGVYFGAGDAWYARFFGGLSPEWTERVIRLDTFRPEGEPAGWDQVDRFRFSVWSAGPGRTTFRLANLRVLPYDPAESFVKNGSFEIACAGIPYAWGSGHWGVGDLPWATDMDEWRRRWRLDAAAPRHGRTSLLIDNLPERPLLKAQSVWITPPQSVEQYALSAWLRSDQDALPVVLQCGKRSVRAEAGRQWRQSLLAGIAPDKRVSIIIAPQSSGKLWIDAVQLQAGDEPTSDFHAAFVDQAIAAREATTDWSPPRRTEDAARGRASATPIDRTEAAIDEHGRFTVNGRPYVQHSLGLEFVSDLAILDFAAESGFSEVCIQIRPGVTTDELRSYFDRCARVGLRVIPWLDRRIPRDQLRRHITALKDHPALLCWYVYDEPSGEGFAEAEARLALAKELDPTRPAFINYLSSKLEDHRGDIYSTDVYPIPHATPISAIGAVQRMIAAARPERKPVWMWLQGTGFAYWMDREPTPRELSCMVYGSLIAGARGIYYFAQIPRTRECFAEMRSLCGEVATLSPVITSLERVTELTCDAEGLMAQAFRHQGQVWVVAVNTRPTEAEVTLGLPGAVGAAEVVFEGRELGTQDGAWRDTFGTYERHVYRLAAR